MEKIVLHGRRVYGGIAEGEALVTKSGWAAFMANDVYTGQVTERGHELRGSSFKGKILVFARGKGSSGFSMGAQALRLAGGAPKALIIQEINPQGALGSVVMRVPSITDLDQDPTEIITSGDWVKVDADNGIVEITKRTY